LKINEKMKIFENKILLKQGKTRALKRFQLCKFFSILKGNKNGKKVIKKSAKRLTYSKYMVQ